MASTQKKSIMRCVGEFFGHVGRAIKTKPTGEGERRELKRTVEERQEGEVTFLTKNKDPGEKKTRQRVACGVTANWSQFLVGFFRPVRRHPPDDGQLSEWATGWVEDHLFCQMVKVHFLFLLCKLVLHQLASATQHIKTAEVAIDNKMHIN